MSGGGFTLVDFSRPTRDTPLAHPPAEPLLCSECQNKDCVYFDPNCDDCQNVLLSPETTIPQIFAVMRQWIPSIQHNMASLTREVLKRGAHVNDRDSLSDLTLLHYAVKSGADGIGNASQAASLAQMLLSKGADVRTRCRWTDMNALHYAAFFNAGPVIDTLLEAASDLLNDRTSCFNGGTALHIGATNLCCEAVSSLVTCGADVTLTDNEGKLAVECIPPVAEGDLESQAAAERVGRLLREAATTPSALPNGGVSTQSEVSRESSLSTLEQGEGLSLEEAGLKLGDTVVVGPQSSNPKTGVLRFYGNVKFEAGLWAGVELDEPVGKHSGSVSGVQYFKCRPKHGVFAPLSKLTKSADNTHSPAVRQRREKERSGVGRRQSAPSPFVGARASSPLLSSKNFKVGDRVLVGGQKVGTVHFSGPTKFASGWWFGIELDEAKGKNDGSINGVRYFTCPSDRGIFAPPHRLTRWSSDGDVPDGSVGALAPPTDPSGPRTPTGGQRKMTDRTPTTSSAAKRALFSKAISSSPLTTAQLGEELVLKEGMTVYVHGKMATVRYIGSTEFADGTWLGVEFRTPDGRHDGTVKGKTYFTCKPAHGLLIKPSKATFHGLNCSQLVRNC